MAGRICLRDRIGCGRASGGTVHVSHRAEEQPTAQGGEVDKGREAHGLSPKIGGDPPEGPEGNAGGLYPANQGKCEGSAPFAVPLWHSGRGQACPSERSLGSCAIGGGPVWVAGSAAFQTVLAESAQETAISRMQEWKSVRRSGLVPGCRIAARECDPRIETWRG